MNAGQSKRLAAIDIGSNSVRLMVAEATPDGQYRVLDDEKRTTRLAHGLARNGRLTADAIRQSLEALQQMKAIAAGYGAERLGVIATSAVREAANGMDFIRRVREDVGLQVEVISPNDEGRLSFKSVERHFDLKYGNTVVTDLGGGSVELVFAAKGIVEEIHSLPLGAVRMTESFLKSDPPTDKENDRLREHVRDTLRSHVGPPKVRPHTMIGSGGTFMALASISMRMRDQTYPRVAGYELTRSEVCHILGYLRRLPLRARRAVSGLNADRADIIIAGVAVIERVMKFLKLNRLQVHDRGVRDGLLLTLIEQAFGRELNSGDGRDDPLTGVRQFAAACGFEQKHSQHVAGLALQMFDQLHAPLHIPAEERLILEAAALLHEIGYLINYEKHHHHSYHLIMHGNLRGLSPRQRELVANVARYHRRSFPKKKHENFARLSAEDRETVRRMSAFMRLADGLDRTHMQSVRDVRCTWNPGRVHITVLADHVPDVDLWGARSKGAQLFAKVFGVDLQFKWQPAGTVNGPNVAPEPRRAASRRTRKSAR